MAKTNTAAVVNETTPANVPNAIDNATNGTPPTQENAAPPADEFTPTKSFLTAADVIGRENDYETELVEQRRAAAANMPPPPVFVPKSEKLDGINANIAAVENSMLNAGSIENLRIFMAQLDGLKLDAAAEITALTDAENKRRNDELDAIAIKPLNDAIAAGIAQYIAKGIAFAEPTPENDAAAAAATDNYNMLFDAAKIGFLGGRKPRAAAVKTTPDGTPPPVVPDGMYLNSLGNFVPKLDAAGIVTKYRELRRAGNDEKQVNALINDILAPRSTAWHAIAAWKKTPAGAAVIASNKF